MESKLSILFFIILILSIGCEKEIRQPAAYTFYHFDGCTGVCEFVKVDQDLIGIQFSDRSDPRMLLLLRSLKTSVFLHNTNEENLRVVGSLENDRNLDLKTEHKFRNFRLDSWYLIAPFGENLNYGGNLIDDELKEVLIRNSLKVSDFPNIKGEIKKKELISLVKSGT